MAKLHPTLASGIIRIAILAAVGPASLIGCAAADPVPVASVGAAWEQRTGDAGTARVTQAELATSGGGDALEQFKLRNPIAVVDGRAIARNRIVEPLLAAGGPDLLEGIIVLDACHKLAAERGLRVSAAEVDAEYEQALRRLVDPLHAMNVASFDRLVAEGVLDFVLVQRRMSRDEFMDGIRRNACLRVLAVAEKAPTDEDVRTEFARAGAQRASIRHIQSANLADVERVRQRLAGGEPFTELAAKYSANAVSSARGGLLDPFAAADENVPTLLRSTAFSLKPGDVSEPLRIGHWFHVIRLEAFLPPEFTDFEQARPVLEQRIRERLAVPAMEELHNRLFQQAEVDIIDPTVKKAFNAKYPDRGR